MRPSARPGAFVLGLFETGLGVVRSLGRQGIHVTGFDHDAREPGFASRYCETVLVPDPTGAGDELVDLLVAHAERMPEPPVLLPASDAWVLFMSRNREALAGHMRFVLPSPEVIEASVDKRLMADLASRVGVEMPATLFPESLDEVRELAGGLSYPVFVKPYVGHVWRQRFSRASKGFKVADAPGLIEVYEKVDAAGLPVMIQAIVPGPDSALYHYATCMSRSGELLAEFVQRKIHQHRPEFGVGSCAESVVDDEIAALGRRFIEGVGFRGVSAAEFKRDAVDGRPKLIELNPRFWLQLTLAIDSGRDFPLIAYRDITGEPQQIPESYQVGRKWLDPYTDLLSLLESRRTQGVSTLEWLGTWWGAASSPVFAWDDPRPWMSKWSRIAAKVPSRLARAMKQAGSP